MTKFRDFGSPKIENAEPISFKIFEEEYICVPVMPGKVMLDMVAKSGSADAAE